MPNLLHGREVAREFFHEKADPEAIAAETGRLIEDGAYRDEQAARLAECRALLGQPGASQRAAAQVIDVLVRRSKESGLLFGQAPAHP
jgi:lipid-A-disaccharide synthase